MQVRFQATFPASYRRRCLRSFRLLCQVPRPAVHGLHTELLRGRVPPGPPRDPPPYLQAHGAPPASRAGYAGPYPGLVPGAGAHRAAGPPGTGIVVRGSGITLRLPPRPERLIQGQSPICTTFSSVAQQASVQSCRSCLDCKLDPARPVTQ